MKVFVSNDSENNGEMLILPLLQQGFGGLNENSMIGIQNQKSTTFIKVVDLKITKQFYTELIIAAYNKLYNVNIDTQSGWFDYKLHELAIIPYNIFEEIDELLDKAKCFGHDETVAVNGRQFTKI